MSGKIILSFGAAVLFSASVFAHLPPSYDASLRTGQTGLGARAGGALRAEPGDFSNKGAWSADASYKGDFTIRKGDTVSHGEWEGKKLWWWAKFAATGSDIPGKAKEGGTSAWVLVNSLSAAQTGNTAYVWKGWNGDLENKSGSSWAEVPTWRNGAKGAYSFTHDDIGAMPFNTSVLPGWRAAKDFPDIKQSWGVYVQAMEEEAGAWENARDMVKEGHEMFNHSYYHTSAANRFYTFNPGDVVPAEDLDIPQQVRGHEVVGAWKYRAYHKGYNIWMNWLDAEAVGNRTGGTGTGAGNIGYDYGDLNGDWEGPLGEPYWEGGSYIEKIEAENELVTITAYPYWEGRSPNSDAKFADGTPIIMGIVPKPGVSEVVLETGQKIYVKDNKVSVNATSWFERDLIVERYPFYYNKIYIESTKPPYCKGTATDCDQGRPGFVLSLHTANGWEGNLMYTNINEANRIINDRIYSWIGATPHFKNGKRSEYFGYPFDVYSEVTHKYLEDVQDQNRVGEFVGARGGAKSGVPMPGDFYHPYRIDFDAFFIERTDWQPNSSGENFVYPKNAHVLLGLNEMVDRIIDTKGYMIREFHAVADFPTNTAEWSSGGNNPDLWPVNDPSKNKGGWWGGIAEFQLRTHYQYVQGKIDSKDIVVYTPSEAVKYRMTANAVSGANISKSGNNYTLTLTTSTIKAKYQDEISVIVKLESGANSIGVEYSSGDGFDKYPYRAPIKMKSDGTVWSVNVNPFRGAATIIPDGNWQGVTESQDAQGVSIKADAKTNAKQNAISFVGIRNGQIALNLQSGNYTAELYNVQGRLISKVDFNAVNGVNATGLRTDNLAKGMLILNVKQAGKMMLNQKIMVK
jgi:hypothetical protein